MAEQLADLTVGLIGAGNIAHVHVAAWKALGARVLVHSHDGAPELASQYGLEVASSLDGVLREVEFVDIVTPSPTHKEIALAAIKAGRNVICEKPLTLTAADSHEVIAAAASAGVRVYPAHVVRFFPAYKAAYDAVRAGRIGDVAVARFFRQASSPAGAGWYRDVARSGGPLPPATLLGFARSGPAAGETTIGEYGRGVTQLVVGALPDRLAGSLRDALRLATGAQETPDGVVVGVGPVGVLLTTSRNGYAWLVAGTVTAEGLARAGGELGAAS